MLSGSYKIKATKLENSMLKRIPNDFFWDMHQKKWIIWIRDYVVNIFYFVMNDFFLYNCCISKNKPALLLLDSSSSFWAFSSISAFILTSDMSQVTMPSFSSGMSIRSRASCSPDWSGSLWWSKWLYILQEWEKGAQWQCWFWCHRWYRCSFSNNKPIMSTTEYHLKLNLVTLFFLSRSFFSDVETLNSRIIEVSEVTPKRPLWLSKEHLALCHYYQSETKSQEELLVFSNCIAW